MEVSVVRSGYAGLCEAWMPNSSPHGWVYGVSGIARPHCRRRLGININIDIKS
jgi:hypothetical protein